MTSVHPAETNFGVVTSWYPLTTTFSAPESCFSTFFVHGDFANNPAFAFDPTFGASVDPQERCQPQDQTSWWGQAASSSTTTYLLGPFICPAAYTTATTSALNSLSTIVGCCPSGYDFQALWSAPNPSQCVSPLTAGQVITYASPVGNSWTITTGNRSTAAAVTAVQINGYIFAASTTSSSTPTATSTISSSTGSTTASHHSGGLSTGAVVAISVISTVVGILFLGALGLFILRQRRSRRLHKPEAIPFVPYQYNRPPNELSTSSAGTPYLAKIEADQVGAQRMHEIGAPETIHELNGGDVRS